jgi:YgiT-type zinc finger domain-containing protein
MGRRVPQEESMNCVICKAGETQPGKTAVILERGAVTLVFKGVPADVCQNCGEAYVSADLSRSLFASAEQAARSGVQFDVREFQPTPA